MKLVVTVIGKDRPGLVEAVSEAALAHGANWEASRMARLAGRFAGVVLITAPDERADELEAALGTLESQGLRLLIERVGEAEVERASSRRLRLEVLGHDRQGIIAKVSAVLARHGINVDDLTTELESAPMAGGVLFKLEADLWAPPELDEAAVRHELEQLANELMVDLGRLDEL